VFEGDRGPFTPVCGDEDIAIPPSGRVLLSIGGVVFTDHENGCRSVLQYLFDNTVLEKPGKSVPFVCSQYDQVDVILDRVVSDNLDRAATFDRWNHI
jgi:hypothetical protein